MAGTILLIVALLIAALLLFAAEVCTPMFGLLAGAALACLAGMVYLFFRIDQTLGIAVIVLLIFALPAYLWAMVKYLPQTAIGRTLQLRVQKKKAGEGIPDAGAQESLVGRTAVTETILRPSGAIRVDGKRIIATAETGFIARGATVKIIKAAGTNVIVRAAHES
jgi:membrane-bound serine protease (ClpP class)